jgi:hypothetical protein
VPTGKKETDFFSYNNTAYYYLSKEKAGQMAVNYKKVIIRQKCEKAN